MRTAGRQIHAWHALPQISLARYGLATRTEKADPIAALPGPSQQWQAHNGRQTMKKTGNQTQNLKDLYFVSITGTISLVLLVPIFFIFIDLKEFDLKYLTHLKEDISIKDVVIVSFICFILVAAYFYSIFIIFKEIGKNQKKIENNIIIENENNILKQQLADAQGEIANLKEQLAGHSAQNQDVANSQTEALELEKAAHAKTREELDATKAKLKEALEEHGLLSEVLKRKIDGEPWETTKAWLQSLGLSASNIGMFLREKVLGDPGYRAAAKDGKPKK